MQFERILHSLAPLSFLVLIACSDGEIEGGGAGGGGGTAPLGPIEWKALPTEGAPSPRYLHTAVWTGSKMIIWGGDVGGMPPVTATGGVYDPEIQTWKPTSMQGAPAPRHSHTAVWTGSKMIVWGGYGAMALADDGGIYDPETDTWTPMSKTGQPSPRQFHSAIWAGSRMIIWGGYGGGNPTSSGAAYDPQADAWTSLDSAGAPSPRFNHGAVWTGSRMIVWGGYDFFDWKNDGAIYDPAAGSWAGPTDTAGAPERREQHSAVWTGSQMLVWGGWNGGNHLSTGGIFNPSADADGTFTAMADTGAPSPRVEHVALMAGGELVVWGGCGGSLCAEVQGNGGRFAPDGNGGVWSPVEEQAALGARRGATGVYTGTSIIVWGGRADTMTRLDTGAEAAR